MPPGQGSGLLILTGSLTINEAADWRAKFVDRLSSAPTLLVDVGALTAVDTIGLQLLCSARRTAAASGGRLVIRGQCPVLSRACEAAGLSTNEIGLAAEDLHP